MVELSTYESALIAGERSGACIMANCGSEHGKVCSEIEHLQNSDRSQWKEIDGMKRILMTSLGAIIVTMLGVIINLVITVAKAGVAHP